MKQALIYSLKVWLTAMCLAFIGMWETNVYTGFAHEDHYYAVILGTILNLSPLSLAFALPFFLSVWVLLTMQWTTVTRKSLLTALTFVFGWWPFMFLVILNARTEPFSYEVKRSILVYILLNCASIWFYKLKPINKTASISPAT